MNRKPGKVGALVSKGHQQNFAIRAPGFLVEEHYFGRNVRLPWHLHHGPVVVLLKEGRYEQQTRQTRFICRAGEVVVVPGGIEHREAITNGAHALLVWVDESQISTSSSSALLSLSHYDDRILKSLVQSIGAAAEASQNRDIDLTIQDLLLELSAILVRRHRGLTNGPCAWLGDARNYIDQHLNKNMALSEIASAAGVSRSQLARAFRDYFGRSVGNYILSRRVRLAADEIAKTSTPLTQIAIHFGFYDQSHFSKSFRQYFGMSPGAWRVQHIENAAHRSLGSQTQI